MKHLFTIFIFLFWGSAQAQVPDWAWTTTAGGNDNDEATNIAADASGNIFVTGYFSGASLVAGTTTLSNNGTARQFFLIKYNRAGELLWAKSAGGTDDEEGTSISVDNSGNVYVCGNFESTSINFGGGALTNNSNPGMSDMFLVKYSPSGTLLWSKSFGGGLQDVANGIDVNGSGDLCMTGSYFSLSVLFGSYGIINSGVSDAFVVKFNSAGVSQWAKRIGGGQTDNGNDVGIDNSGNVYVTGNYNSTTVSSFSPGLSNSGGFDVFIAKFDAAGNSVMAQRFGGSADENSTALLMQSTGGFFICGYFESGSLQFGTTTLTKSGARSMLLVKYNSAGAVQWAKNATGSQNSIPADMAEGTGSVFMTGSFDLPSVTFGSSTLNNGGSLDGFVVNYDQSNGNVTWAKTTGSQGLEQSQGVAVAGGFVHIAGMYTSTLVLRDAELEAKGATDAFLTKLCLAPAEPLSAAGATVCEGSTLVLNASTPAGTSPVWFTAATGGSTVHQGGTYNLTGPGTFYVAARDTNTGCGMYSSTRLAASGAFHPPLSPTVSVNGHTLSAAGNGSVSAWYDCAASTTISGGSSASFVLTTSGSYAVIMTSPQGCMDTSTCDHYSFTPGSDTVIVTPGLLEFNGDLLSLEVYPNPTDGYFFVKSNATTRCELADSQGRVVQRFILEERNGHTTRLGPLPRGIYFILTEDRRAAKKVIISR